MRLKCETRKLCPISNSKWRDIPFNQKPCSWSSKVIHDFNIIDSIGMDLKVMPISFSGYNYLLVMHCNHSCYVITDTLKTRKATNVAESIFQKLICAQGTNIKEIYCDLDTAFKNEIMTSLLNSLGITVKFCSVQSHQSNTAECTIQSISNILIHYIAKYGNLWCIMMNMVTFCLNIFSISHLQNLRSYEIIYGRKPPAMSDLQLKGDSVIRPPFYHFTDYLDLLNKRIHAICDIVKTQHNQTIEERLLKHGSESPSLRSFNEGDIVYYHFLSKNTHLWTQFAIKKVENDLCWTAVYLFEFMYLLATINDDVIKQMFHISRLKKGLLRLPNGRTVKNINDYKLEMIKSAKDTNRKADTNDQGVNNSTQTCVKTVLHNLSGHEHIAQRASKNIESWYEHTSVLQHTCVFNKDKLSYLYHAHPCMMHSTDILVDTVFSPAESLQETCNS